MNNQSEANQELIEEIYALKERIRELKQSESDLKETSKTFSEHMRLSDSIFDAMNHSVCVIDPEGRIIKCNRSTELLLGKSADELINHFCFEVVHGISKPLPGCPLLRMKETKRRESAVIQSNGRWLEVTVDPMLDDSRHILGAVHIVVDITDRKQAETELEEHRYRLEELVEWRTSECEKTDEQLRRQISERKKAEDQTLIFRYFAEASGQGLGMATLDGDITYVNPTLCRLLGEEKPEDVCHKKQFALYYPHEMRERLKKEVLPAVMSAGQWVGELGLISIQGKYTPTIENFFLIRDEAGNPLCLADVITDITERKVIEAESVTDRKRAEEALRENELFLEETQKIARLGGWKANPHTDYLEWTRGVYEIIEAPHDYKPGLSEGLRVFLPEYIPIIQDEVAKCLVTGKSFKVECEALTLTGKKLWTEVRGFMPILEGAPSYVMGTLQDITDRKQTEEFLKESEKRFREMANMLPQSFCEINLEGRLTFANKNAFTTFGYTKEELDKGINVAQVIIPEDYERAMFNIQKVLGGEERGGIEYTAVKKGGSTFPALVYSNPIIKDNQPLGIRTILIDITERDQADKSLRASEDKLKSIFRASPVGIGVVSERVIMEANDRLCAITGYKHEELVGQSVRILYPDEKEFNFVGAEKYRQIAKTGTGTVETIWCKKNGKIMHILLSSSPFDPGDMSQGVTFTALDITDRKQVEGFLKDIIAKNPMSIQILDKEGLTLEVNSAYKLLFGSVPPANYSIFNDPQLLQKGMGRFFDQLRNGEIVHFPDTYFNAHDSISEFPDVPAWIRTIGFPLNDSNEKPERFVFMHEDITARKQAEEEKNNLQDQLTQAQRMEFVGRLAGGVAHDFNNMLSVILGHTELVLQQIDPEQPLHGNLEEVRKAAERSADLTRQLLAFARKQTIAPRILDLNETIDGMLKMLRRLIGEDIDMAWIPDSDIWQIKVDPAQVDQILANILVNARDAIAGVGKVTIETENVEYDEAYCAMHADFLPGEYVKLSVSDTGCGMDQETLRHIFEPFFTTKETGKGTGLGMATVYGIVKQNNGFINVYSEPDKGTTFKIYLPRYAGETPVAPSEGPTEAIKGGLETILLVEDEPSILRMCENILEGLGYRVLTASTPGEAIGLAEKHAGEIHLLMTDVVMPKMNGRDLAKRLLSLYPSLKRLFMSGYTANVIAHHGILDEGVCFIQKPFSIKNLADKVREALDQG
jgi:PAS domain S-box-containing protein